MRRRRPDGGAIGAALIGTAAALVAALSIAGASPGHPSGPTAIGPTAMGATPPGPTPTGSIPSVPGGTPSGPAVTDATGEGRARHPDERPTAACRNAEPGWLDAEVARPGEPLRPDGAAGEPWSGGPVLGYLDRSTLRCGETAALHLATRPGEGATAVLVQVLRVGAYPQGPLREVWRTETTAGPAPAAVPAAAHETVRVAWPVAATLRPDPSWPPGMYLIRLTAVGRPLEQAFVPLRLRTTGVTAPRLVIASDLTQLAYNTYGGSSLYGGSGSTDDEQSANRAWHAWADRPLVGTGLQQAMVMDLPLASQLDRHRLTADWTSDSALDDDPGQLAGYPLIVLPGHSEYWTRPMYDALEAHLARGGNLAVLGANEIYWQARPIREDTGRLLGMTVYRRPELDPIADRTLVTGQWRAAPLRRDPAALTGTGMAGVDVRGSYTVVDAPDWLFAGTGLTVGSVIADAVGNESDAVEPPGRRSPPGVQVLMRGDVRALGRPTVTRAEVTLYRTPSGGVVFTAGTTYWLCRAEGRCPGAPAQRETRQALSRVTARVLAVLAQVPPVLSAEPADDAPEPRGR